MELDEALVEVARGLASAQVPYMVIGGMANLVWGAPRATLDIDVTVGLDIDGLAVVVAALDKVCVSRTAHPQEFVADTRVLPMEHSETGIRVDIIFALLPFEHEAISRARDVGIRGAAVRFCSPEDLILHKIVSHRLRDRADAEGVIKARRTELDREYLDPRVHELAEALEEPDIVRWYLDQLAG
jgi:hypothetical protein